MPATSRLSTSTRPIPETVWHSVWEHALTTEESDTGSTRSLHFRDNRPPHEIQFALERNVRSLFTPSKVDDKLCLDAKTNVIGASYSLRLSFLAALPQANYYSLRVSATWPKQSESQTNYYLQNSRSWFEVWTRDLTAADPPLPNEGSTELYNQLCDETLNAERHLDSVVAIQQAIIAEMKQGATFGTSHKEGGTNIFYRDQRFVRSDYGDYPDTKLFADESDFLKMLYQFCSWDIPRNSGESELSEIDTWRLIMRKMDRRNL